MPCKDGQGFKQNYEEAKRIKNCGDLIKRLYDEKEPNSKLTYIELEKWSC